MMQRFVRWFDIRPVKAMLISLLVSLAGYACLFYFKLAVMIMLILLIHEMGHVAAARLCGLGMTVPVFLPFVGAVVRLRRLPLNAKMAADVALGGPAAGCCFSLICMAVYYWTLEPELLLLTCLGSWFNLLNLVPVEPLDGGKIMQGISTKLGRLGMAVCFMAAVYLKSWLLLILAAVTGVRQLVSGENVMVNVSWQRRSGVLISYLLLAAVLSVMALWTERLLGGWIF